MSITFDGANRIIQIGGAQTDLAAQDIYEAWKEWVLAGNAQFPPAFRSIGGDPLGAGVAAGAYFFLNNVDAWRLRPEAFDHELVISGNLFGEDPGTPLFLSTVGDYQVLIRLQTSSLTQSVAGGGGGGLTSTQAAQLERADRNSGIIPALL